MKHFFLWPLLVIFFLFEAGAQDTNKVSLITPIVETPPLSPAQASAFSRFQTYRNWGIKEVGLDSIMSKYTGKGTKICICDTGKPRHVRLRRAIEETANFTDEASSDDLNGHSTHVAGIAQEIAPDARLYIAKVLNSNGSGTLTGVAKGIRWCKEKGVQIINLSLGGGTHQSLRNAVLDAAQNGIIVIAAAGNEGQHESENRMGYPARYTETLAVGASTRTGEVAVFSSSGAEGDIIAPGEKILSTWLDDTYIVLSGTSMATPFVSGMAALLIEKDSASRQWDGFFRAHTFDIAPDGFDRYSFYGLVSSSLFEDRAQPIEDEPDDPKKPDDPDKPLEDPIENTPVNIPTWAKYGIACLLSFAAGGVVGVYVIAHRIF